MTVVGMYVCGAKQDLPFFMFCPAMTKFLNGCIGMPRCIRLHPHCGAKSSKWPLGPGVSAKTQHHLSGHQILPTAHEPETPWAQEKICRNPSGSIRCTRFLCPTHQEGHIMSIRPLHQEQQAKVLRVFSPAVAHMLVVFQVIYYEIMVYDIL